MPKLDIQHIRAGYGDLKVLFDVSLHVDEGEIVSLVGSNGAGKTTLLRIISGFEPVTSGSMRFGDRDLISCQPYERAALEFPTYRRDAVPLQSLRCRKILLWALMRKRPANI